MSYIADMPVPGTSFPATPPGFLRTTTPSPVSQDHHDHEHHDDIVYPAAIPFILVHLAALGVFWTGFTATAVVLCVSLYFVRMWALTAGFHRYFSHRSYKTSRVFQFILAFLGQTSAQRGVIWWSAMHRHHHLHSDTEHDTHSPVHGGFFHSHVGWIFKPKRTEADYETVKDLTRYPELVWLDRHAYLPAAALAVACFLIAGWPGLFVGFILSTVILYHGVFAINSLAHTHGNQRFITGDQSRNNWWLALITLGEGWHNNHHHYQSSTRQGWRWWEIDISYYVLKALSWVGVVWDLRAPPEEVVRGERRLGRKVIEKVAHDLAGNFQPDELAVQIREAWAGRPGLDELQTRWEEAKKETRARFADLHLPQVPSVETLERRVREIYVDSPSVEEIATRAREILLESVEKHLFRNPVQNAG